MGVIATIIAGSEDRNDSDDSNSSEPDENGQTETPYLSPEATDLIDPFITAFDRTHFNFDAEDVKWFLGFMILVSSLLGD